MGACSDDEWLPQKLEKQMKVYETVSLKVGVVYTGFLRIRMIKKNIYPIPGLFKKKVTYIGSFCSGDVGQKPTY